MPSFEPFENVFPETASRETRAVIVDKPSRKEKEEMLPSATYEFHELFCAEPECDCERVVFAVISPDYLEGEVLAQIELDLGPVPLHKRLLGAGKPRLLADLDETGYELSPEGSRYSNTLLRLFSDVVAPDSAYIERVHQHRKLFREALTAGEKDVYSMPGGRPPLDRKTVRTLTRLYKETRALSKTLHDGPILQFQPPEHLTRSAARLGMLAEGKTIVVDSEADFGFLVELSYYGLRSETGETLVQRYAAAHGAETDEPTRRLLSAMAEARFGMLQVISSIPRLGAVVRDVWRDEEGLLADLALSNNAPEGSFAFGHYLRLPEFWMSAGGMLGVPRETALMANSVVGSKLQAASAGGVDALSPRDQEELAVGIMHYILTGKPPPITRVSPRVERHARPESAKTPSTRKRRKHRSR